MTARHVFVSIAECGHAQAAIADISEMHNAGRKSVAGQVIDELRHGYTVKRVTLEEYQARYHAELLCGCLDKERTG